MSSRPVYWLCAQVAPSGECSRGKDPSDQMLAKPRRHLFVAAKEVMLCMTFVASQNFFS